jgi:carbonic anhydrase/SulP family sulfate permease
VSGPAAGLTAVVATQIDAVGSFHVFLAALILAGVLQMILGLARAGILIAWVPKSVITGLLAAIGLILIIKQTPYLMGYVKSQGWHEGSTVIGFLSLALIIVWPYMPRFSHSLIPVALLVVLLGVFCSWILALFFHGSPAWTLAEQYLVQVPITAHFGDFLNQLYRPDLSSFTRPRMIVPAITLALVASLETILNLTATDSLDPHKRKSPVNREMCAQGIGNMVSGLLGGLPVTSVIVRSASNIHAGAKSRLSAIVHGLLLLLCVVFIPTLLNRIPLSCLAAILLAIGFKLTSPKVFREMWEDGWQAFLPFIVTIAVILATDLLKGVAAGLVVHAVWVRFKRGRRA